MRLVRTIGLGVVCLLLSVVPARAERSWSSVSSEGWFAQSVFVPSGPHSAVSVWPVERDGIGAWNAKVVRDGQAGPVQDDLEGRAYWNMLAADGSATHGAVVAWVGDLELFVAEAGPADDGLAVVRKLQAHYGDYSYGAPKVAVGPNGDAAVVFLRRDYETGEDRVWAIVRPAGGAWGAPEPVGPAASTNATYARSVAVGPTGTVWWASPSTAAPASPRARRAAPSP